MAFSGASGYSKDPLMRLNIFSCDLQARYGDPSDPIENMKEMANDYKQECDEIRKNMVRFERSVYNGETFSELEYARSGKIIKRRLYENGAAVSEYIFRYDSAENVIESVCISNGSGGAGKRTKSFEYDGKGNVTELIETFSDAKVNNTFVFRSVYDWDGRLTAVSKFRKNFDGRFSLQEKDGFKYDGQGECIEYSHIREGVSRAHTIKRETYEVEYYSAIAESVEFASDKAYVVRSRTFFINGGKKYKNSYTQKGELAEVIYFDKKGGQLKRTVYEYDAAGRLIREKKFDKKDSLVSRTETTYSGNDKLAVIRYDRNGLETFRSENSYATEPDGSRKKIIIYYNSKNAATGRMESYSHKNGLNKGYKDETVCGEKRTMEYEYEFYK